MRIERRKAHYVLQGLEMTAERLFLLFFVEYRGMATIALSTRRIKGRGCYHACRRRCQKVHPRDT